jgi:hypothetical protein
MVSNSSSSEVQEGYKEPNKQYNAESVFYHHHLHPPGTSLIRSESDGTFPCSSGMSHISATGEFVFQNYLGYPV